MDARRQWRDAQEIEDSRVYQLSIETQNKSRTIALDKQVKEQARMAATKRPKRQPPEAGNLVLVQDHQRDKNHGRKLDPQ